MIDTKKCTKCGITKSLNSKSFHWRKDHAGWRSQCIACHKKSSRIRYYANREKYLEDQKVRYTAQREFINSLKNVPCADCGKQYDPICMDFDHVRGKKLFEISNISHFAAKTILAEVAKCEVVCANCHRLRHKLRKSKGRPKKKDV